MRPKEISRFGISDKNQDGSAAEGDAAGACETTATVGRSVRMKGGGKQMQNRKWMREAQRILLAGGVMLMLGAAVQGPQETAASDSQAESIAEEKTQTEHVSGIKDFSVIEGMAPDTMAGIVWDESVETVVANTAAIDYFTPGTYPLIYTVVYKDGRTERETIQVTVHADLEHYLYGMEGNILIQKNGSFDPMEHIVYEEQIESVEADTSALNTEVCGEYLIPYILTAPDGRVQSTVRKVTVTDETQTAEAGNGQMTVNYSTVQDLGLWRLTAYMDTPADQGRYVGQTASGAPLVAGRTVAVSAATCARLGLQFGDRLMIDGHVYVLEDHGGSAMYDQNWVDIFVDNPGDEYSDRFNRYAEVYLLR